MSKADREFVFNFINFRGARCELTAPVAIPLTTSVAEFAYRLISVYDIPCYCHSALIENLEEFYLSELTVWHRQNAEEAVRAIASGNDEDVEQLTQSWAQNFAEEHVQFARSESITNEEVFSDIYHTLIHSPTLNILLGQEHSYALAMEALVRKRDTELTRLQACQSQAMEKAVEGLGATMTDEKVNALAVKQLEDTQMLESKWESEISALRETQKRSFQYQLVGLHEDYHTSGGDTAIIDPESVNETSGRAENEVWTTSSDRLEESFTIHLGAQLKQMHNLRLLSADVLDLCHIKPIKARNAVPQRLQTAMSLYSNNLCGLVLLVDSRVNSYTGIKRDFARSCQSSTEFHFTGLEDQLEDVRDLVSKVGHWRQANKYTAGEGHVTTGTKNDSTYLPKIAVGLRPGDVYVTRHSNLAEVHVVFHVVVDDSIRSNDISSRHPVILALRNVLKVACLCDVNTVTMPLLLVHEMSEEMTMSWCLKRSELIYKCIKGFMIEMASWGGAESRTVQFMVPKGISDDLFSNLSTMLPSIFRMSNPLKVKL